jgi:hypothetical protein
MVRWLDVSRRQMPEQEVEGEGICSCEIGVQVDDHLMAYAYLQPRVVVCSIWGDTFGGMHNIRCSLESFFAQRKIGLHLRRLFLECLCRTGWFLESVAGQIEYPSCEMWQKALDVELHACR